MLIITPTHDPAWLGDCWKSLQAQTYKDWRWLVVPNNGVKIPEEIASRENVNIQHYSGVSNIGAIKRFCCEQAIGDEIVVELDHDDMLTPTALEQVAEALESSDFVYSNFAEFQDETYQAFTYDARYGWQTRVKQFYGRTFTETLAFEPTAQSLSSVHFAPNHVRAWRNKAYWDIGGHDSSMKVCDDHDLCCRFYLSKRVKHIDDCLYLYRLHGDNNYLVHNAEIQARTLEVQDKYIWKLAERQADLAGLLKVDLGAAHGKPNGYIGVDQYAGVGVDIIHDVSNGLPFEDDSVGVIRAFDFLEHIDRPVQLMNEIYRVLADSGWLISMTPSTDGRGAFQDPTHISFWNENSFWYYTDRKYTAYVPQIACRFQAARLKTHFPSEFHRQHDIPYVYADLTAVKSWRRRPGLIKC